ncbi:MAG: efflux RND transporter permease subunit [Desulfobacterales bacterium]
MGHWSSGSPKLERFNGFPSINIQGEAAPGRSSGEAMAAMEGFIKRLPQGFGYDWTGLSYQERQAGTQVAPLYAFSILVIFLCLAALYELAHSDFDSLVSFWQLSAASLLPICAGCPMISIFRSGCHDHGTHHEKRHSDRALAAARVDEGLGPAGGDQWQNCAECRLSTSPRRRRGFLPRRQSAGGAKPSPLPSQEGR